MAAQEASLEGIRGGDDGGCEHSSLMPPVVPTHVKHVASLLSMEGLSSSSDGSLSDDFEEKSSARAFLLEGSRGAGGGGGRDASYSRALEEEEEEEGVWTCMSETTEGVSPFCGTEHWRDYISDLTVLSHAAIIGDAPPPPPPPPRHHHSSSSKAGAGKGAGPLLHAASATDAATAAADSTVEGPAPLKDKSGVTTTYEKLRKISGPIILFSVAGLVLLTYGRSHLFQLLDWLEHLPLHASLLVFVCLFTLISFPFGFGYIILNMMAGYLYGIINGQAIVMVSVAIGQTVAFLLCRRWFQDYARSLVTSNALQAMLRVVEGPHSFKVIFLTRFTPIPFGLQNVLFSMTSVKFWQFFFASVIGLLPTQLLNTYTGSTVRSMQEVLTDRIDGYIILGVQVVFSLGLMFYLLHKARKELAKLTHRSLPGEA